MEMKTLAHTYRITAGPVGDEILAGKQIYFSFNRDSFPFMNVLANIHRSAVQPDDSYLVAGELVMNGEKVEFQARYFPDNLGPDDMGDLSAEQDLCMLELAKGAYAEIAYDVVEEHRTA